MTDLLKAEALTLRRGRSVLLEGFALTLGAGDCVALRGPNGVGKSTLLRCIAGLYSDYDGEVSTAKLAYLGHHNGFSALLSVEENLRWYAQLGGFELSRERLQEVLEALAAQKLRRRPFGSLSAGQQRRVALARLRLVPAPLWLLDEPYTALDADGVAALDALLAGHCEDGGAVLAATHAGISVASNECWLSRP